MLNRKPSKESSDMQGSTSDHRTQVYNTAEPLVSWNFDHAGFLRCKTSVLKSCVLSYSPSEIADKRMPAPLRLRKEVKLFVPEDELAKDGALDSLEGRPVSVDHFWQTTLGTNDVGSVAGRPIFDDETKIVFADILIKDPVAIKRITADDDDVLKLIEQSAGYLMEIEWTPGITEDGEAYDGIQRDIKYNHIALVGEGEGRAGSDIRILNKRGKEMSENEFTQMKFRGETIRVMNADVPKMEKLENAMDEKDETMSQLIDPERFKALAEDIKDRDEKIASLNADRDSLTGQMDELKAKIEELQNPEEQERVINKVMGERESAQRVFNSLKRKSDSKELQDASEKAKSLQGHSLHGHVVNAVRTVNKRTLLTEEELANGDIVSGMFSAIVDMSDSVPASKSVAGAEMSVALNSKGVNSPKELDINQRRQLFHDLQKGKQSSK